MSIEMELVVFAVRWRLHCTQIEILSLLFRHRRRSSVVSESQLVERMTLR